MWMRGLWTRWKIFAEKVGAFQSRVLLVFLYFVVVTPFALLVRMCKDPLRIKRIEGSNWIERQAGPCDLEGSRRQF